MDSVVLVWTWLGTDHDPERVAIRTIMGFQLGDNFEVYRMCFVTEPVKLKDVDREY